MHAFLKIKVQKLGHGGGTVMDPGHAASSSHTSVEIVTAVAPQGILLENVDLSIMSSVITVTASATKNPVVPQTWAPTRILVMCKLRPVK